MPLQLLQEEMSYKDLGARFLDPDHLLNRKREMFKIFKVEPRSNRDQL